jgi:hypothetical protein
MVRACSLHGGAERIFVGKSEEERLLGRHRLRWENNIKKK